MTISTIDIIDVQGPALTRAFLDLPYEIYKDEPQWRPPLRLERKAQYSHKNPGRAGFKVQAFLARHKGQAEGRYLGRIAAFINPGHQARYQDGAGHFGYFDCIEDGEAAAALLSAAKGWHQGQGSRKIIGPSMWSVNEECGLLVDGFEHPPAVLMPFGHKDYPKMMEAAGYAKAVDLWAYQADLVSKTPRPRAVQMLTKKAETDPGITIRPINMKNYKKDIALAMDIFNDAWSENWGFVPFNDAQVSHMAKEMRPILSPDLFWFALVDGKETAFGVMIPDVNQALTGLGGKLLPFGWAQLLYRLKIRGVKGSRIPLMGLRQSSHRNLRALAGVTAMCERLFAQGAKAGFETCELSWILEDNQSMQSICDQVGAQHYKTYRMYEKVLA